MTSSKILTFDPPTRGRSVTVFRESAEDIRLHEVLLKCMVYQYPSGKEKVTCIKRFFLTNLFQSMFLPHTVFSVAGF